MIKQISKKVIALCLLVGISLSGCGSQFSAREGTPIEPITPDTIKENSLAVGTFNVKDRNILITDLAVTADGSLTVIAAERVVYLLQGNGMALWEKQFTSAPQKTYMDPEGRFLAVGTEDGKLTLLTPEKNELFTAQFDTSVAHISASKTGELLLVGLSAKKEEEQDRIVAVRLGKVIWEKTVGSIIEARIAGADNLLLINWIDDDIAYLGAYSAEGEPLWKIAQSSQLTLDSSGQILITSRGNEILRYNEDAKKIWVYTTDGKIKRIQMAEGGLYLAALIKDETTQQEELLYLDMEGNKLWQMKIPIDADILVSADGSRVITSSWRQYQEDVTKIRVYNQQGQLLNTLDIAGRAQKMAFAAKVDILVLGLEDGSIYYINIAEKKITAEQAEAAKEVADYYNPVEFIKKEGEAYLQLFFFDDTAQYLIPVTRRIKNTQSTLTDTIAELVRGPVQSSGLMRTIPKDAVVGVTENEGTVLIDLPESLAQAAGSTFLSGILDSLLLTVSSMKTATLKEIRFTVAGKQQATFGQEGIMIDNAFIPLVYGKKNNENLLFLPYRSGGRYYLRPQTKTYPSLKSDDLMQAVVLDVVAEYNKIFRAEFTLKSVRIDKNIIYADFTSSLNKTLVNTAEAAARAALLRDAIVLTLVENSSHASVVITVNGVAPEKPSLYLPWELTVIRPYYINMEN